MSVLAKVPKRLWNFVGFQERQLVSSFILRRGNSDTPTQDDDFRVLNLNTTETVAPKAPRETNRSFLKISDVNLEDVDWSNVWVGPKSFNPYVVPLPVRQGYNKNGVPPTKYGNSELMKIPNFLHLTPPAVEKHCKALKAFCTPWPQDLNANKIREHFPVRVIASDYCNSLPTIRDPLARIITIQVNIEDLNLNNKARDKFLRLVGDKYNPKTGIVTITAKNCPLKKQNYDHAMYILTALVYESLRVEDWEKLKSDEDMESYIFIKRKTNQNLNSYFSYNDRKVPQKMNIIPVTERYISEKETVDTVSSLKTETLQLLGLTGFENS